MLRFTFHFALWLGLLGLARSAPLAPRVLFELPALDLPTVSPSGKQMIILSLLNGQQHIAVLDLATLKTKPIGRLGTAHVTRVVWKGEEWLYLELVDGNNRREFRSVDLGSVKVTPVFRVNWDQTFVHPLPDSPDEILLAEFPGANTTLTRFNIRTDKSRVLEKVSGYVPTWVVNQRGEPIAAQGYEGRKSWVLWREPGESAWRRRDLHLSTPADFQVRAAHEDGRRLLALDRTPETTARVVTFDPRSGESTEIFRSPEVDPGTWIVESPLEVRALGVRYQTDRVHVHFFEPEMGALQRLIDEALPNSVNFITSAANDRQVVVIAAATERDMGIYYLLDRSAKKLMPLGPRYPAVNAEGMGAGRAFAFAARDGLPIHGRLLLPPRAAAPPPLVVIAENYGHGNRSSVDFDWLGQLFASRGYAVARIDYRGTHGYGREFAAKGAYQVAKGIPHDIEDGVKWILSENLADPKRVIMAGFNTGGWPAMHALANSNIFAGWINWNTPMQTEGYRTEDFALARRTNTEATTELGGREAAGKFLESINPADLLPRITVPSFHYYFQLPDQSLANYGDMVERHYKRTSTPHVIAVRRYAETRQQDIDRSVAIYDQLFAFLAKHFPLEARP